MVWTWAWDDAGNEAGGEEGGDEWAVNVTAHGAACGAGLEAEAAPVAEGDLGGTWTGKEGGFVNVQDEAVDELLRRIAGTGAASPRDCAG